jgi:opacity protein-like surface antigen
VGVNYNISEMFAVRAEYERYGKVGGGDIGGDVDVDVMSVGVAFKF